MNPKLTVLPEDRQIPIDQDESVLEMVLGAKVPIAHACGGNAKCSSCRILVLEGLENFSPRNEEEKKLAESLGFPNHVRLACQTRIKGATKVKRVILDSLDMEVLGMDFENGDTKPALGREIEASMLFADIEGYTEVVERSLPYDVVHLLKRYYLAMGKIVANHNGQIMDYFGDGFLAIFGMDGCNNHPTNAYTAGKAMQREMQKMQPYYQNLFGRDFKVRIGINTGKVILGRIGIKGMQKLAAIGDAVNMASRIEAANKTLGCHFLVSEATFHKLNLPSTEFTQHQVALKGKKGKFTLYKI